MKNLFPILLSVLLLAGCTESAIENDRSYADTFNSQFEINMDIDIVKGKLEGFAPKNEFYNECLDKFEYPVTPCEKGYNRILTIPLPSNNWWIGKGDAQFYFYFNSKKQLIEHMYELYYPRYH